LFVLQFAERPLKTFPRDAKFAEVLHFSKLFSDRTIVNSQIDNARDSSTP
jgi:hypothetical protein